MEYVKEKRERRKIWSTETALDNGIERHKRAIQRLMAIKVSLRIQAANMGIRIDDEREAEASKYRLPGR